MPADAPQPPDPRDTPDQAPADAAPTARKPLTARRLRRKLWRVFLFVFVTILIAGVILTRTGITRALILPRLESALGAEIDARSVVINPDASVLFRDVVVRVPDVPGPEGEVFRAERLLVEIDWSRIPTPAAIAKVELESPVLRLSQNADTGAITAARLGLFSGPRGSTPLTLPTVVVRSGRVELGEHDSAGTPYAVLAEFPLSGVLAPQPGDRPDRSLFSLTQRAGETGLEVTGYIDPDGVTFTVGGVDLNDWPTTAIPSRFRDLWEQLQLDGRIIPRTVAITSDGAVAITVDLQRVALTLPFTAENARSKEPARLSEVTGRLLVSEQRISADLTGRAGPLEQRVQFDFFGFDPQQSPFVARLITPRLRWERDIAVLDYVPPDVIEQTDRFGQPEADVEAVIWLARRLPDIQADEGLLARYQKPDDLAPIDENPVAVRLSGALAMRNGTAAFRGFPYPFHDLSVDFRFNTRRLLVENIDGISRSGARLTGGGSISPLGPTSAVDLDLTVTGLTIDEDLLGALNPARRKLVDVLFNEREYAELVDEGLIRTPEQVRPILERLEAIEAEKAAWAGGGGIAAGELARLNAEEAELVAQRDSVPVFALGGEARVDMRFIREEGVVSIWTRDIRLNFPTVGFLTEMFAMPAIGRDVEVTIGEDEFTLAVEDGKAINGGDVTIDAVMDTSDAAKAASPDGDTLPRVRVEARDIPIGPLLIRAIAGPESAAGANGGATDDQPMGPARLADLLTALGLGGQVDADADIVPNYTGDRSRLDYTIRTRLEDLTADIAGARTRMTGGSGSALVDRDSVELDITGDLVAETTNPDGSPATAPDASLLATIQLPPGADWGDLRSSDDDEEGDPFDDDDPDGFEGPVRARIDAAVVLPAADLAIPAEPIVALFSGSAADKLADLRARYRPEGRLGITTTIRGTLGDAFADDSDINVALTGMQRVDFDYESLRLAATDSLGHAIVLLGPRPRVAFDAFSVDLATIDAPGRAPAPAGRLSILETVEIGEAFATTPLSITLERGRFESPLTRRSIQRLPTLLGLAQTYEPRGLFDLDLRRIRAGAYEGAARPRTLTVRTPRGDLAFPEASGAIAFAQRTGAFEDIHLRAPGVDLHAQGDWTITGNGTEIDLLLDTRSDGLPPALVGLAPQTIGEVFDALDLAVAGETTVESLDLAMRALPGGGFADVRATGVARFADASLAIGLPVTEATGSVAFDAERPDPARPADYTLDISAERARFMGLRVTGVSAHVMTGEQPASVLVPDFVASAHGGRISAAVRLSPPDDAGARRYWTDLHLAEVRIAPLLEDVRVAGEITLADEVRADLRAARPDEPDPWDQSADRSRGLLSANFSLTGTVGQTEGRRGRGRIIAGGGPVLQLPLLTPLIEFSSLQIPSGDELGLAYANLLMDSRGITFEHFAVLSDSIELVGYGDMTLPGAELDIRVRSRAVNRIPVLTSVVESVRDELISTRLTGTIGEPKVTAVTLEETRRVLGSLMGGVAETDRLREISQREADARARIRRAGSMLSRSGAGEASPTRVGGNDAP